MNIVKTVFELKLKGAFVAALYTFVNSVQI